MLDGVSCPMQFSELYDDRVKYEISYPKFQLCHKKCNKLQKWQTTKSNQL